LECKGKDTKRSVKLSKYILWVHFVNYHHEISLMIDQHIKTNPKVQLRYDETRYDRTRKGQRVRNRLSKHVHTWVETSKGGTTIGTRIKVAVFSYNRKKRCVTYGACVYTEDKGTHPLGSNLGHLSQLEKSAHDRFTYSPVTFVLRGTTDRDQYCVTIREVQGIIEQMVPITGCGCDSADYRKRGKDEEEDKDKINFVSYVRRGDHQRPKVLSSSPVSKKDLAHNREVRCMKQNATKAFDACVEVKLLEEKRIEEEMDRLQKELQKVREQTASIQSAGVVAFLDKYKPKKSDAQE